LRRETNKNEIKEWLIEVLTSNEQMGVPKEELRISFARALQIIEFRFPAIFVHTNLFFEEIAELKNMDYIDYNRGEKTQLSWLDAIFISYKKIREVNKVSIGIPLEMFEKLHNVGMSKDEILNIVSLISEAQERGVRTSLISMPTDSEKELTHKAELVKGQMREIQDGLQKACEREFEYEWLSKNDVDNAILGLYCNCCAHLAKFNTTFGKRIAEHSISEGDIQNLVVRNKKGTIIAKATLYVKYIKKCRFRIWCN
jgi:hypothetical protein